MFDVIAKNRPLGPTCAYYKGTTGIMLKLIQEKNMFGSSEQKQPASPCQEALDWRRSSGLFLLEKNNIENVFLLVSLWIWMSIFLMVVFGLLFFGFCVYLFFLFI